MKSTLFSHTKTPSLIYSHRCTLPGLRLFTTWADLGVRPSLSDGAVKVVVDSPGTQAAVGVVVHGVGVLPLHILQGNAQLWINRSINQCFFMSVHCKVVSYLPHPPPPPPPPNTHTIFLYKKNHISVSYANLATGLWAISLTTKVLTSVVYKISYSCWRLVRKRQKQKWLYMHTQPT